MKTTEVRSLKELKSLLEEGNRTYLLLYRKGSDSSDCAYSALQGLSFAFSEKQRIFTAEVSEVRDIHPEYRIESVPSLLDFDGLKLENVYKGCNGEGFYRAVFSEKQQVAPGIKNEKTIKRVTVYSTPTCSWCTTIKNYFKENNIAFRDVDVSRDQKAAEEMVRRSGQQGVPQTDINGEIVVGFDKARIDRLLELNK
ncbi:MAG: glutaredoxin family protein [Marinilabiliaceae bacterium]|jgi:glutaredoxin-like YruB-family protein|nr:glutaredoxin family protein [Marinilabiliaceae bacterium]